MTVKELKKRRKALGLTQGGLAKALGVSKASVSAWEQMRFPPPEKMLDLALEALEARQEREKG